MKSLVSQVAERYAKEMTLRQLMTHRPAEADEEITKAYLALSGFKGDFDAMHEIPSYLMPYYRQALKAVDKLVDARRETYQLRMMIQKGFKGM